MQRPHNAGQVVPETRRIIDDSVETCKKEFQRRLVQDVLAVEHVGKEIEGHAAKVDGATYYLKSGYKKDMAQQLLRKKFTDKKVQETMEVVRCLVQACIDRILLEVSTRDQLNVSMNEVLHGIREAMLKEWGMVVANIVGAVTAAVSAVSAAMAAGAPVAPAVIGVGAVAIAGGAVYSHFWDRDSVRSDFCKETAELFCKNDTLRRIVSVFNSGLEGLQQSITKKLEEDRLVRTACDDVGTKCAACGAHIRTGGHCPKCTEPVLKVNVIVYTECCSLGVFADIRSKFPNMFHADTIATLQRHLDHNLLTSHIIVAPQATIQEVMDGIDEKVNVVFVLAVDGCSRSWSSLRRAGWRHEMRRVQQTEVGSAVKDYEEFLPYLTQTRIERFVDDCGRQRLGLNPQVAKYADHYTMLECIRTVLSGREDCRCKELAAMLDPPFGDRRVEMDAAQDVMKELSKPCTRDGTSGLSYWINVYMRSRHRNEDTLKAAVIVEAILRAMNRIAVHDPPLQYRGIVYRGMRKVPLDGFRPQKGQCLLLREILFTSTSHDEASRFTGDDEDAEADEDAENKHMSVFMTINLAGARGSIPPLKTDKFSIFPQEQEVLLPPLSVFEVKDVRQHGKILKLDMDLVWTPPDVHAAFLWACF